MQRRREEKGSITIYLLLSLLLITALICTAAESARMQTVRASLREITYMAADSCFAEYAQEIFDDYGIMALWKTEPQLMASYQDYISRNLDSSDLGIYHDTDLQLMQFDASALVDLKHITDENGAVFRKQVYDYMDYFLIEEAVTSIMENLELFQSGEKLAAFVEKVNSYRDVFIRVGTTINKIQTTVEKIQSRVSNPKALLGNMLYNLTNYKETGKPSYAAGFHYYYWNLQYARPKLEGYLDMVLAETNRYREASQEAQQAIQMLQEELQQNRTEYTDSSLTVLEQQLEELALKSGNDKDYYGVAANEDYAVYLKNRLLTLDQLTGTLGYVVKSEDLGSYQSFVESYYTAFQDFDPNRLGLLGVSERVKQENSGFLATIWNIVTRGILKTVTDGKISDRKLDMKDLPSAGRKGQLSFGSDSGLLLSGYRRIQMLEYIFGHFGNYQNPDPKTALQYEAEYLLQGKTTDKANLKATADDLVKLREGLNLISFLKDTQKMNAARNLALGIIGFTGNEALIEMVKMTVMAVWCLAESLCDVKALMKGKKVPAVKEPQEWTVSAVGLKNFSKSVLPVLTENRGLDYEDHLRILLLKRSDPVLSYRMMDLMQANACKNHNANFRMEECVAGMKMETLYHAPALFASFPFVNRITGGSGGSVFYFLQSYAY